MLDYFNPAGGYIVAPGDVMFSLGVQPATLDGPRDGLWSEFTGRIDLLRLLDVMTTVALSEPDSPDSACELWPTSGPALWVHREAARAFLPVLQRRVIHQVGDAQFLDGE